MSSPSGGSILMTSAPTSASSRAQYGPASMIEKSSTRMPSSGAVLVSGSSIPLLLSGQSKPALCDEAALNFIGPNADDPHQGMTKVLFEPSVVERARHMLGERGLHAQNVERGFAKALHELAREHLADRAIFRRRNPFYRQFRAMHHQLAADLNFARQHCHSIPDDRVFAERRRVAFSCHHMFAQLLEGVRHLQNDAATNQPSLKGQRSRQYFPSAINFTDEIFERNADVVVKNVGKGSVIQGGRGSDGDARRIHGNDEHADSGVRRLGLRVRSRGKEHVFSPPGGGPD